MTDAVTLPYRWRISRRSFALRGAFLLIVTALICAPLLPVATWLQWAVITPLSALFYMWVFDDFRIWTDNRNTTWELTHSAIAIAPTEGTAVELALTDIRKINRWPLWSLVLRLNTGPSIVLPLPPKPAALRRRILVARDTMHRGMA